MTGAILALGGLLLLVMDPGGPVKAAPATALAAPTPSGAPGVETGSSEDAGDLEMFPSYASPWIPRDPRFASVPPTSTNTTLRHTTFEALNHRGLFGMVVSGVGDVNADGFADVAVSAPRYGRGPQPEVGRVYLFHGSASGPTNGIVFDGPGAGTQFGRSIASGFDFNHDGVPDLLVGATKFSDPLPECGGLFWIQGGAQLAATQPQLAVPGTKSLSLFGMSVSAAGDINGDGYLDVLVAAPKWSEPAEEEGAVLLYLGDAGGLSLTPAWIHYGGSEGAGFGSSLAVIGDINQDGFDDVAIGAPHYYSDNESHGQVHLFLGSVTGLREEADWIFTGLEAKECAGASIAGSGDLNGDGVPDLVIGAPGKPERSTVRGHVYIFFGPLAPANHDSPSPAVQPTRRPDQILTGQQSGAGFGFCLAIVGDMTGDGFNDLAVGAPYQRISESGQGRMMLYAGGRNGVSPEARTSFDGPFLRSRFGCAVAPAGDVDGDGLADFLIGSPYFTYGNQNQGRADLIYGSRSTFAQPEHFIATVGPVSHRPGPSPAGVPTNPVTIGGKPGAAELARPASARSRRGIVVAVALSLALAGGALLLVWRRQQREAVAAVRRERERLARELHDNVAPELTRLALIESQAAGQGPGAGTPGPAQRALQSMGELVWVTQPKNDSLDHFIAYLGDYAVRFLEPGSFRLDLNFPVTPPALVLPAEVRQHLFLVVKEALNNILKHSRATEISLSLHLDGGPPPPGVRRPSGSAGTRILLQIRDDGRGFNPASLRPGANGLDNMRARIDGIGGRFELDTSPGRGTEIRIDVWLA